MAFRKTQELPKDAILMDETEASVYIWDLIDNWKSISDTWALRYSATILGGVNAVGSLIMNNHYRKKLRLGTYGHMSSIIPIALLPAAFTTLFHRHLISTNMLLRKNETCPICYEIKSAAIQHTFGIVYPMVLAPLSAFMFANRYNTYRMPSLLDQPKELFKLWKKITKPLSGALVFMIATQFVFSAIFTYFELRNTYTVRNQIIAIENEMDSELDVTD